MELGLSLGYLASHGLEPIHCWEVALLVLVNDLTFQGESGCCYRIVKEDQSCSLGDFCIIGRLSPTGSLESTGVGRSLEGLKKGESGLFPLLSVSGGGDISHSSCVTLSAPVLTVRPTTVPACPSNPERLTLFLSLPHFVFPAKR